MATSRPLKRQRTSSSSSTIDDGLPTPPEADAPQEPSRDKILSRAQHVLATEAAALCWVSTLYQTDKGAIDGLYASVDAILDSQRAGGKVIVCGVGKSAYIGMKLVATCKSLGVAASFMHACEAVHGDLGDVRPNDVVLFVSFSGKTPELMNMLPHLPAKTKVLALSSHASAAKCALLKDRSVGILLPAPIPEAEEITFGLSAPTTSTTVALAVADMLALTVAEQMHGTNSRDVFKRNHPGGAIGVNHRQVDDKLKKANEKLEELLELPSPSISAQSDD